MPEDDNRRGNQRRQMDRRKGEKATRNPGGDDRREAERREGDRRKGKDDHVS